MIICIVCKGSHNTLTHIDSVHECEAEDGGPGFFPGINPDVQEFMSVPTHLVKCTTVSLENDC